MTFVRPVVDFNYSLLEQDAQRGCGSLEMFRARLDVALGNLGWWSGQVSNPAHSKGGGGGVETR